MQPDNRVHKLWHLVREEGAEPWRIAAETPICPLCGEALAAHVEGVGEPDMAIDNPFVGYIKALQTAA